ncbi:Vacuolar fusion protein [Trichinella spiralis]|uniref:Vacuolar fusion protein n=1 Tax=Trichinella spiralis TaxID=6334 RepID=A0ABR3KV88_TRISP
MQDTIAICSTSRCVPSSSGVLSQRLPTTIQWNRVWRVKHGFHQFHHGIELHAPVGVLQSHGQSLRFCAYRLVADREDVAEGKTFRPTTLLVHPSRSGDYDWKTLESTDVQPTQLFKAEG